MRLISLDLETLSLQLPNPKVIQIGAIGCDVCDQPGENWGKVSVDDDDTAFIRNVSIDFSNLAGVDRRTLDWHMENGHRLGWPGAPVRCVREAFREFFAWFESDPAPIVCRMNFDAVILMHWHAELDRDDSAPPPAPSLDYRSFIDLRTWIGARKVSEPEFCPAFQEHYPLHTAFGDAVRAAFKLGPTNTSGSIGVAPVEGAQ